MKIVKRFFKDALINFEKILILFSAVAVILNFLCAGLKLDSASSFLFKISIVLISVYIFYRFIKWLVRFIKRIKAKNNVFQNRIDILLVVFLLLTILSMVLGIAISKGNLLNFGFLTKFIITSLTIVYIYLIATSSINAHKIIKILSSLFALLSIFLFISYVSGFGRVWRGEVSGSGLTLNYYNPNYAAEILFLAIVYLIAGVICYRSIIAKSFFAMLICVDLYLLYLTSSRNPFVALLFAGIIALVLYLINRGKKKLKLSPAFFVVLALMPLIFSEIYLLILSILEKNNFLLVIGGKTLDTRFDIWINAFKTFIEHPFLGAYTYFEGSFQMHNSHLDFLTSYGLISFGCLVCFLILLFYRTINLIKVKKSTFVGLMLMLSIYCFGLNEASFLYSGSGTFILAFFTFFFITPSFSSNPFVAYNQVSGNEDRIGAVVLQINSVYDFGSTGYLVKQHHKSMLKKGINSYVIYGRGSADSKDENVVKIGLELLSQINKIICKIFKNPLTGCLINTWRITTTIRQLKPDVVHLHCLNDFYVNTNILLKFLKRHGIPVVITNHSEILYLSNCGGNAYDCMKWAGGEPCSNCPKQKTNTGKTITNSIIRKRTQLVQDLKPNIRITSVSPWLYLRAKQSKVFSGLEQVVVLNGTNISNSLKELNKHNHIPTIFFPTASISNPNKGFKFLLELATIRPNYNFVVASLEKHQESVEHKNVSFAKQTNNKDELAKLYASSNCTLVLSKSETFSMTTIESLSCGTPVVGFKAGGPESIALIDYCRFVDYGNTQELAKALDQVVSNAFKADVIRTSALEKYSLSTMTSNYIDVYNEISEEKVIEYIEADYCIIDV